VDSNRENAALGEGLSMSSSLGQSIVKSPGKSLAKLLGYGLCRVLPIGAVSWLGALRGRYSAKHQKQLDERVQHTLHTLPQIEVTTHFLKTLKRQAGRAALDMLIADRIEKTQRIRWLPHAELTAAIQARRPLVFVSLHMGNLGDINGVAICQHIPHYHMGYVTRKVPCPVEQWIAQRSRTLALGQRKGWVLEGHQALARTMLRELMKPPACVLLHIDEARHHQVWVPSFGRSIPDECNLSHAVRLARLSRACLVPMVAVRRTTDAVQFDVHVLDLIDRRDPAIDDAQAMRTIDRVMEQAVRRWPEQWLSLYHLRMTDSESVSPSLP
jgi:lauroyl/myristoyl acyltransferase